MILLVLYILSVISLAMTVYSVRIKKLKFIIVNSLLLLFLVFWVKQWHDQPSIRINKTISIQLRPYTLFSDLNPEIVLWVLYPEEEKSKSIVFFEKVSFLGYYTKLCFNKNKRQLLRRKINDFLSKKKVKFQIDKVSVYSTGDLLVLEYKLFFISISKFYFDKTDAKNLYVFLSDEFVRDKHLKKKPTLIFYNNNFKCSKKKQVKLFQPVNRFDT